MNRFARLLLLPAAYLLTAHQLLFSQATNDHYLNFNISGPTNICPNGNTVYTYSGPITNLTWTINGGVFIGSNVGQSVSVKWNTPGSLSAYGTYTEQDCWYDPDTYPPVLYCNTDNYHYTSNSFTTTSEVASYNLSGGAYCTGSAGALITLSGSQTDVNYQLKVNGVNVGSALTGTGSSLSWGYHTATGTYTVVGTKTNNSCSVTVGSTTVSQAPLPTQYLVGGGGEFCTGGTGVSVTLSGSQSGVNYQLKVNGSNSGIAVSGTGNPLTWPNQTTAGTYTVVATSMYNCVQTMNSSTTVVVSPLSVGGTISGSLAACGSASGTLILSNYTGSVQYWTYYDHVTEAVGTINNTSDTLSYSVNHTTSYSAVVKSGSCNARGSSDATVKIDEPVLGGEVVQSADVYAPSAEGQLSLNGSSGADFIIRWEKNTDSGWTAIPNTKSLSYNYNITQSTSFRAISKNGVCPETSSTQADINLYPALVLNPTAPQVINYGQSVQLSVNAGYHEYQWYVDGFPILGANAAQYTATKPGQYFVQVKGSPTATAHNSPMVEVKSVVGYYGQTLNAVSTTSVLVEGVTENTSLYSLSPNNLAQTISYKDGLGRTFQTVEVGRSPMGGDIVMLSVVSKNGLTDSTFLPYSTPTASGFYRPNAIRGTNNTYTSSEQYQFYQNTPKVAADNYPFARTLYRNTPDAKVIEQGAPGADWQPGSNHTVRNTLTWNDQTTYRVRYWKPDGTTNSNYPSNSVAVTIITDENNNKVRTYTNSLGQTVLKQVQENESSWLETYYIYDEFGRLKYIVPPKALAVLGSGTDVNVPALAELIYTFTYDSLGRLVEKKVPGAAVEYIVYDKLDRVVLTQDGNLRSSNKWMFVKYDRYNRIVYSGLYQNNTQTTRTAVQGLLDAVDYATTPWYEAEGTTVHGYTNLAWPTTGSVANTILSVMYYDHYNFDRSSDGSPDYTLVTNHLPGQVTTASTATRGLPTGSKRVTLNAAGNPTTTWLINVVFYDQYDRPIQTRSNNHLYTTVADISTVIYDFAGKVIKSKTTHYQNATTSVAVVDRNEYDHAGRVLKTFRQINDLAEQLLAQYEYNALGQLVDKKLHDTGGGNFLQSVDLRYTIRGWLKSINNAQLTNDGNTNDDTNDYFGMELLYNTAESGLSNTQYYNGNISAIKWKGPGTSGVANQRSYAYTYDKTDRLTAATFKAHSGINNEWTKEVNTLDETIAYDVNGNITALTRKQNLRGLSGTTVTSTPQIIDNLTYTYASINGGSANTNQLVKVEDAATLTAGFINGANTASEYTYTPYGSMSKDDNKGITGITYNFLGKPQVVNFNNGKKIEYLYDAAGTKLCVKTYQGTTLLTNTNYSGSFVYEGATPVLSFFSSPEGRVVKNGSTFEYQYALADHQGNTRLLFTSATPSPQAVTANMEASGNSNFLNYTNRVNFNLFDHTDAGTTYTYSQKLTGGNNSQVGVAKTYKVYAGDKVKIEAWAKYTNPTSTGSNLAGFAGALLSAFGLAPPAGGETGTPSAALNTWGALVASGNGGNSTGPKAFVNIIVFDKNYNLLDAAWEAIDPNAHQVGATPVVAHDYLMSEYIAKEEGYVYLYVSNENPTLVEVYFDDIVMTHTKSNIIQYNEYYPFGMQTANSWTRENVTGNNFLYNGATELNPVSAVYDLYFRNYDPALARMNAVDPMASKYASLTPYNYAFNDPVFWNDPSGDDPWNNGPYAGSMAYYYAVQLSYGGMSPGQEAIMDPGGGSKVTWDDITKIIDRLWKEVPKDGGGASWSKTGGFTGGYGNMEAFYVGAGYMDKFGMWGGGGGTWASSFESAAIAFANATGGPILLRPVTIEETRTNAGWLQERIDETYTDVDNTTPWEVGWEWLTGEGPRHRDFVNGDLFTEMLKQHDHIQATREIIKQAIANGGNLKNSNPYYLGGVGGVGKYAKDYSTLATAGQTGNLAVTYLGSYSLTYQVIAIVGNTALVSFVVNNSSTIESATHPPVIGYTQWWSDNIGQPLNDAFSTGPMSKTTQTFQWTETIRWK